MNAYDCERMAEALGPLGYALTPDQDQADLVILNTCHIREKAAEKVYSELGRARLAKEARKTQGRETMIAVAGCVAQAEGREIMARAPVVDIVVGPQSYHRLADLVAEARATGTASSLPNSPPRTNSPICRSGLKPRSSRRPSSPCRKAATNSAPSASCRIRGAPSSRARRRRSSPRCDALAARGAREITLLGQNVNAYHGADDEGRVVVAREPAQAPCERAGHRAAELHHQPSARHGRRV